MSLFYKYARLPDAPDVVQRVADNAERLYETLSRVDASSLDISDYNRSCLVRTQRKLRGNLERMAYILVWGLAQQTKAIEDLVVLEYGGGIGMLSLLAKTCGVGTVIYSDIYDVSRLDAETIANAAGIAADHYVCGDIDDVVTYVTETSLSCDALVSSDVIEHVYDTRVFFSRLAALSSSTLAIAMSTHANDRNPYLRRVLMKKQRAVELTDREHVSGHKKRDGLQSYLSARRDIVSEVADGRLTEAEIDAVAASTRGWITHEIHAAVMAFLKDNAMPLPLQHPTNTCDPHTGNWADRLVDPRELTGELVGSAAEAEALPGYYGTPHGFGKRLIARTLDLVLRMIGAHALALAPYVLFVGSYVGTLLPVSAGSKTSSTRATTLKN